MEEERITYNIAVSACFTTMCINFPVAAALLVDFVVEALCLPFFFDPHCVRVRVCPRSLRAQIGMSWKCCGCYSTLFPVGQVSVARAVLEGVAGEGAHPNVTNPTLSTIFVAETLIHSICGRSDGVRIPGCGEARALSGGRAC